MVRYHITTETGYSREVDSKAEVDKVTSKIESIGKAQNVEVVEVR